MVINHVPANAPSHMRQTIGLESAAACTSMYDGCHPWANDGPIFVVVRGDDEVGVSAGGKFDKSLRWSLSNADCKPNYKREEHKETLNIKT